MREGFYRQTARVEDAHWWFVHRRRLVESLLARRAPRGEPLAVLDVGCGSGGNLEWLSGLGHFAVGVDRSALALELARARGAGSRVVRARAQDLARVFARSSFSLVTLFNVLYHEWIEDEAEVLSAAHRVLAPGGMLLLTEPAFAWLRRRHDAIDLGARRFTRTGLERLVREAGFEVVESSYFNLVGLAPAAVVAALDCLRRADEGLAEETGEIAVPPHAINRLLLGLCSIEQAWIDRVGRLPGGVGLILLARAREARPV